MSLVRNTAIRTLFLQCCPYGSLLMGIDPPFFRKGGFIRGGSFSSEMVLWEGNLLRFGSFIRIGSFFPEL